jgi:hypothetical protein
MAGRNHLSFKGSNDSNAQRVHTFDTAAEEGKYLKAGAQGSCFNQNSKRNSQQNIGNYRHVYKKARGTYGNTGISAPRRGMR